MLNQLYSLISNSLAKSSLGERLTKLLAQLHRAREWIVEIILPQVPGTRRYRRRIQRLIVEDARHHISRFTDLHCLDINAKKHLAKGIRYHEHRLARSNGWQIVSKELSMRFIQIGVVVFGYATPIVVAIITKTGILTAIFYFIPYVIAFAILVLIWVGILLLLNLISFVLPKRFRGIPQAIVVMASPVVLATVANKVASVSDPNNTPYIVAPFIAAVGFAIIVVVYSVWYLVFDILHRRQKRSMYPDSLVVDGLLRALHIIDKYPENWGQLEHKRIISARLDEVTMTMSHDLTAQLRTNDPVTNTWLTQTMTQAATAIRSLKKWVLTPRPDTRDHLITRLTNSLASAVTGNWDSLLKEEPEKITRPQRVYIVLSLLKVLFLAVLPLGILWLVQLTPLALQGDIANYVKLGAIIWVVLTLLSAFDPTLSTKIGALKDVTNLVPFVGQKKP